MARWRQSFVFSHESEYGKGHDSKYMLDFWYAPPPGSEFTSTYNRDTVRMDAVGNRKWGDMAYGKVTGSWKWTFPLDYDHMEPFMFVFDSYSFETVAKDNQEWAKFGKHVFKRTEYGITPSFCVRRKTLHRVVGGEEDEIDELYGCVCTTYNISLSAGGSQIMVSLSGIYSDEYMGTSATDYDNMGDGLGKLSKTDNLEHKAGNPVEYSCLHINGEPVADVQSMSVQSKNSVYQIYSVLNPISRSYYEGKISNSITATVYSKNPKILRQRVYSGGAFRANKTKTSGVVPLKEITMESKATTSEPGERLTVSVEDIVIKSMGWVQNGSNALLDKLESADCKDVSLEVINKIPYQYDLCMYQGVPQYNRTPTSSEPHPIVIEDDRLEAALWPQVEGHFVISPTYEE